MRPALFAQGDARVAADGIADYFDCDSATSCPEARGEIVGHRHLDLLPVAIRVAVAPQDHPSVEKPQLSPMLRLATHRTQPYAARKAHRPVAAHFLHFRVRVDDVGSEIPHHARTPGRIRMGSSHDSSKSITPTPAARSRRWILAGLNSTACSWSCGPRARSATSAATCAPAPPHRSPETRCKALTAVIQRPITRGAVDRGTPIIKSPPSRSIVAPPSAMLVSSRRVHARNHYGKQSVLSLCTDAGRRG